MSTPRQWLPEQPRLVHATHEKTNLLKHNRRVILFVERLVYSAPLGHSKRRLGQQQLSLTLGQQIVPALGDLTSVMLSPKLPHQAG